MAKLAEAIARAEYVAWTSVNTSVAKKWDDLDEHAKRIIIPQPPNQQVPRGVSFVGHTYIDKTRGGIMCARCGSCWRIWGGRVVI